MNGTLARFFLIFIFAFLFLSEHKAHADVSWSSGTQSPGDYTSSGIVTVTGNVTLAPGTYTFATLIVNSGVTLTLQGDTSGGTGVIINATTVTITGTMSADGQGYPSQSGTGAGASGTNGGGGGHGGAGTAGSSSLGGIAYGSISQPVTLGSGGGKAGSGSGLGGAGGGAIKLVVSGTLTVSGTLSANGKDGTMGYSAGGGAGGSIWITAGTLTGAGSILANGGSYGSGGGGGGGGGRIWTTYTTNSYTGSWATNGGTGYLGVVGGSGSTFLAQSGSNNVSCVSAITQTVASTDFPSPLGSLTIQGGCNVTTSTSISPSGNVVVTGAGSKLNLGGDMTSTTGAVDVNTNGAIYVIGNTTTGYGYTISGTNISIDATSTINATGLGYPGAAGPGAGGSSTYGGGGGYGGAGGAGNTGLALGGAAYGTVTNPTLLGSGGGKSGSGSGYGGAGGGAIKVVASGTLTINGTLAADGKDGTIGYSAGGGSGGSIWVAAGTLAGAGTISANGGSYGSGGGGGGGGGRIYFTYSSANNYTGTLAANAGSGYVNGGKGSILTRNTSNNDVICNSSSIVTLTVGELPSNFGNITVTNGCNFTIPGSITGSTITANTTGVLQVQGFANLSGSINATDSGTKVQIKGDIIAPSGNINITSSAVVQAVGNTTTGAGATIAATNITIDSTSSLNADGLGYPAATGTGAGGSASSSAGGGGYGGAGGAGQQGAAVGGATYGSALQPTDLGSGGGNAGVGAGGAGGGAMKIIVSGTLSIAGSLSANGTDGAMGYSAGGGSGGSIWIDTNVLSGAGTIRANGGSYGSGAGGAGGGGRIYYGYTTNSFTGTITANKGSGYGGNGSNGTINSAVVGAATKLVFSTQPSSAVRKSEDFPTQPVVSAVDASNNVVTTYSTAVSLTAYTDSGCTSAAGGTFTVGGSTMGFGITWFSGVKYGTAMTTIYLKATSGSLTSACSTAVAVGGAAATQFVITTQPSSTATAGSNFAQQPVVQARDASGNPDYLYSTALTISPYTNSSCTTSDSGTLNGSGTWSLGTQTLSGTNYNKAGVFYIGFSTGSFSACSNSITVSAGAAFWIMFTTQPSTTASAGVDFAQQPVVTVYDTYFNVVTGYSTAITLTAYTNASCTVAGTGTLNGGSSGTLSNGVDTFSGVDYTKTGNLYLKATSGGMTDCSTKITVSGGTAAALSFTTEPASKGVAGVNLKTQPVVTALDAYGNVATSYSTAITLTPTTDASCSTAGGGTLTGSATTSSGVASFSNVRYSLPGTVYIKASSGALTTDCSTAVSLVPTIPMMFRGY
ncbi:MAG: hypothetical protein JSU04_08705 [Bdellovibrionales bacterium]|nr:hypothetical protein [Bdellovibrionales bacterium]